MSLLSNTAVLLGKELRTEFRSRELLTTTGVFILIVLVLFSFAVTPGTEEARQFAPGLLWLAILFASSLMFQSCFLREQSNDTLSSLRLAVSDPFSIFLAKLLANTLFLLLTELFMLPFFALFYNIRLWSQLSVPAPCPSHWQPWHFHHRHRHLRYFRAGPHARIAFASAPFAFAHAGSGHQLARHCKSS